jgi:hypothetical protein
VFTVLASAALLAIAPASALAHHGRHSRIHHRVHHARAHMRHFGTRDTAGAPSSPSGDTAGTVASFSGGVLTIKLNDGSMVSGKVTDATEMECTSSSTTSGDETQGSDDQSQESGDQSQGSGDQSQGSDDDQSSDQSSGDQTDGGDHGDQSSTCSSTAPATGTVVRSAELKISSAGAVWDKLELVTQ